MKYKLQAHDGFYIASFEDLQSAKQAARERYFYNLRTYGISLETYQVVNTVLGTIAFQVG